MTNNINEKELENVTGGWQYANGSFVNYGNYIVYTVAPGDVLSGIGQRFGVSYMQIAQWNNIKNPDLISIGQKLTIYPAVIRFLSYTVFPRRKAGNFYSRRQCFCNPLRRSASFGYPLSQSQCILPLSKRSCGSFSWAG